MKNKFSTPVTFLIAAVLILIFVSAAVGVVRYVALWSYERKAPVWVTNQRLMDDGWNAYRFTSGVDRSITINDEREIYFFHGSFGTRSTYYECSASLDYHAENWILRVYPKPAQASEECFRWALGLDMEFYRGDISFVGEGKVIYIARDRAFKPDQIVLVLGK
ncbi:MAG: hypothetical protein Q8L37_00270 [Candidatus Gottesmanbacteria bacterium]|nr:hypothetical protein [Candidatus Gottesmanbacteria bacterium]